jgi:serine/threonine protein kinase/tetratricopeptide (TPR) repeat protein
MRDTVAHYRLVSKIGEGGMGVVYAADDQRLQRRVAIKMIRRTDVDPVSRERLWREARAAASVSHPNVCQLYEIGEADGELFIAMELLEGEPLSGRLLRGAAPLTESVDVTIAVLSALEAIHARSIVHRDLKPSNVFLTPHGVKLLDFGLARTIEESGANTCLDLTTKGAIVGTPQYMSPEQLRGDPLDARSDLFAVGAILVEMLVGSPAFPGKTTAEVFHAIAYEPLRSIAGSPALVAIDGVVRRATQKRPTDRYPDAQSMARELRTAAGLGHSNETATARRMTRLIVLPFRMLRPDPEIEFLAFGLADAITASLGSLGSLIVRSSLAASRFKIDAPDLAALASGADVDAAVTGTLMRAGDQVRVASQLVETPGGRLVWSETAQAKLTDLFQLQDELTRHIVESLAVPLSSGDERMLARGAPANPRAYEYFLRANELASDPKSWSIARDLYEQALKEDPRFAPAWAALGRVLRLIGKLGGGTPDDLAGAATALARALELNPDQPLAHNVTAQLDIDRGHAREAMVRLIGQAARRRNDADVFAGLVYACRYCGLLVESKRADEAARRLDASIKTSVLHTFWMLGEHEAAVASKIDAPALVTFALMDLGRERDAIEYLMGREARVPPQLRPVIVALRALLDGRRDDALAGIRTITAGNFRDTEGLYYLARVLAFLGAGDDAIAVLRRATAAGFNCYPVLASDAWLNPIRQRPEFVDVLQQVKQEHELARVAFAAAGGDRLFEGA